MRRRFRAAPASLVLYDLSTLHYQTDAGDGFREPGAPRNAGPQITIALFADAAGFLLAPQAFGVNRAETTSKLPVIRGFQAARRLPDVTVAGYAGMLSATTRAAIAEAGLPSSVRESRMSRIA